MDIIPTQHPAAQLTDAFRIFNQLSEHLADSYRGLEEQVAKLTQELAAARSERLKTLVDKEKLAFRLQTILAALPAGVVIVNDAQTIIDCNALALEFLNEPLLECQWPTIVRERLISSKDQPHESLLSNGKCINLTTSPLDDSGGQLILLTDISDMRALEDSVNRQKQLSAMGEMVASMAHQVRTPLATAILYASQMSKPTVTDSKRQVFAVKIMERLHHLNQQVNDMLIFAKEGRLIMGEFELKALLHQLDEAMRHVKRSNFEFCIRNETTLDLLPGNQDALQGAVMNLLTNAVESIDEEGLIQLTLTELPEGLRIEVRDNGCGIKPQLQPRIFEPFFTTKTNGTGLGLAVVASVIQAHHGELTCHSTPGEGTVFTIDLPLLNQVFRPLPSRLSAAISPIEQEFSDAPL